jgi:hypothetical protein
MILYSHSRIIPLLWLTGGSTHLPGDLKGKGKGKIKGKLEEVLGGRAGGT